MNKLLIVFNICEINGRENVDRYITYLDHLIRQNGDWDIVVSSCLCRDATNQKLKELYGDRLKINIINEKLTVNVTFNKTVQTMVELNGEYEGYLYIDSGIDVGTDPEVINRLYNKFKSGEYGMACGQTSTDTGFDTWFGYHGNINQDLLIPVGKACNLHFQIFHNDLFKAFDKKLMPDVFAAYCTESTFSFLNAALHKQWIIASDVVVGHIHSMDGGSSGFHHLGPKGLPWNNLLYNRDALEFITNIECINAGMGYEEVCNIMMHKADAFDENGYALYPDKLLPLMKKYWYLTQEELDYSKISSELI